jgi:hypothetical protein
MQPDQISEGKYRVITQPRPIAEIVGAEIDVGFTSAFEQEAEQRARPFIQCLQGLSHTQSISQKMHQK